MCGESLIPPKHTHTQIHKPTHPSFGFSFFYIFPPRSLTHTFTFLWIVSLLCFFQFFFLFGMFNFHTLNFPPFPPTSVSPLFVSLLLITPLSCLPAECRHQGHSAIQTVVTGLTKLQLHTHTHTQLQHRNRQTPKSKPNKNMQCSRWYLLDFGLCII